MLHKVCKPYAMAMQVKRVWCILAMPGRARLPLVGRCLSHPFPEVSVSSSSPVRAARAHI
jgi:hypothetical protein